MNVIGYNYICHNIIDISIQPIDCISDDASASIISQTAFTVACIKQTFLNLTNQLMIFQACSGIPWLWIMLF